MEGKGENGLVEGSSDCEDERAKLRPADIDADVREMERRKRVEAMMSSRLFREELERIVEAQMKDGAAAVGPLLQQIQDMIQTGPARANTFSLKSTNCVIPINDIRGVESMGYAKGEKMLRCKLAAVYRLMDLYGWTQGIQNHVTGRLNQEEELLLVNAYGMLFHEVTASSLVKVDMQGNIVEPGTTNYGVNVQGFHLHAAIHQARPDIKCIIHVHTPSVLAVSSLKAGLLPLSNESVVIGEVSSHQSTGSIQEPEEKDKLARNLGPINKVMLLSNHGAVCCGETVEEAFFNLYNTVLACESQMKVMPLGIDNLVLMTDEARKAIYDAAHRVPESTALPSTTGQPTENKEKRWRIGGLHFEALMRMLDNAGFRTGYIYRTPLIKGEPPKPRSDVEVPPAVSSLGYLLEEEEMYRNWKKMGGTKNDRTRWLNSPNVYQKVEILETGTPDPKKITKWVDANAEEWVADGSPTHSSTPVKISDALQFVPKNTNPKEFKKLQQQIKENRRADKITSGPQSHILEGVTWEEAKKLQDANLTNAGDQVVLVGAASKGIIQREYQHNATVYKTPYAKNPFDSVSAQEIEEYKRTVIRKQRGESYDEEASESEALSSSAALPPSGLKSPPSETDDDSRTEPRVLRIETKTAPIPSQAEYVLSDDALSKVAINRIKCFTRIWQSPSPACKERPVVVDLASQNKHFPYKSCTRCQVCKSFIYGRKNGVNQSDLSSRSTQTILSIHEMREEELCSVSASPVITSCVKKPPVARKLDMDSVIEELKDKLQLNFLKRSLFEKDRMERCPDEEITLCTIHPIPQIYIPPQTNDTPDSTSDETTVTTSVSTDVEKPHCQMETTDVMQSHIGDFYQGSESMSEKPTSPDKFPKNPDSFVLSDLLSNFHVIEEDGSCADLFITHHTNITKAALLIRNQFNLLTSKDSFECKKSNKDGILDVVEDVTQHTKASLPGKDHVNILLENDRQEVINAAQIKYVCDDHKQMIENSNDINNNLEKSPDLVLQSKTAVNGTLIKCENYSSEKNQLNISQKERASTINSVVETSPDAKLSFLQSDNSRKGNSLNLMIEGKDLYHFYNEFDPDEVFQADPDNVSIEAHYDNLSMAELKVEDNFQTSLSDENSSETFTCDLKTLVNENIFIGKKYLMKRYLCGKLNGNEDVELSDSSMNCKDTKSYSFSSLPSLADKHFKTACTVSEDSAVFSELTLKNSKLCRGPVDSDNIFEWSFSENSKGEFSVDSSGSSGVRVSTSDDDVPNRQTISSIDEFLIKETVCKICPYMDQNLPCNSRLSGPISPSYFISPNNLKKTKSLPNIFLNESGGLLTNVKHLLTCNYYKMPDESKIRSYYTLVSGLDKSSSLPDISRSSEDLITRNVCSKPSGNSTEDEMLGSDLENNGIYISDDYICAGSDDDSNDSSRTSFMINDLLSMSDGETPKKTLKEDVNNVMYAEDISCDSVGSYLHSLVEDRVSCEPVSEQPTSSVSSHGVSSLQLQNNDSLIQNGTFKDCFKCFAVSMEDSIDHLMQDTMKRNLIIGSLKKKFSKHRCHFNRPLKLKPDRNNQSFKTRRSPIEVQNNRDKSFIFKSDILNICKGESETPESNASFKSNQSSLYLSCYSTDNMLLSGSSEPLELQSCSNFSSSEELLDTIVDSVVQLSRTKNYSEPVDEDSFSVSSQDHIVPSFKSESRFSILSGNNVYYSLNSGSVLHCSSSEEMVKEAVVFPEYEPDVNKTNYELNTAFIGRDLSEECSESLDGSQEPVEEDIVDFTVDVCSVSCQTDELFQAELEYRAEDYMEMSSSPTCAEQYSDVESNSHPLYTIYETSELSPEY